MSWTACLSALNNSVWSTTVACGLQDNLKQHYAICCCSVKLSTNKIETPRVGTRALFPWLKHVVVVSHHKKRGSESPL